MSSTPRIAVDAMGGDFGPEVVVPGAVMAARDKGVAVVLVGDESRVKPVLDGLDTDGLDVQIRHASQLVDMHERASDALRKKKDSSVRVACDLVKEGLAHGVVSAGNTGATVACGTVILGRIKGVERPALAGIMPTEKKPMVLIDVGANVDSKPYQLAQFGIMADVLARDVLGYDKPRVGLLTIGEEEGKGNSMVKTAFDMLKRSSLHFVGNVEGRDVFTGDVDIVVCDGFVGNVALKLSEGLVKSMSIMLAEELKSDIISNLGALLAKSAFSRFKRVVDSSEYGGAPLLGLKGIALVCHGRSNKLAIQRAVEMAATFVGNRAIDHLVEQLQANRELASFGRQAKAG